MKVTLFSLFLLISCKAFSYESMTRHGYQSCVACHYGSEGGGLLTDYGKIISGTTSVIKGTGKKSIVNDKLSWNNKIDHGIHLRLAHVRKENSKRTFPMQGDYLAAFKGENYNIRMTVARAPKSETVTDQVNKPSTLDNFYFRDLKISFQLTKKKYLTVGREKQRHGLNLVDHTLYVKSLNRTNVTDLSTVVRMSHIDKKFQLDVDGFLPSYREIEDNQEYGLKGSYRHFGKKWTVGFHSLAGQTEKIKRVLGGGLGKYTWADFFLMGEINYTKRWIRSTSVNFDQVTSYLKLSYQFYKGMDLFSYYEKANRNKTFDLDLNRWGVGGIVRLFSNLSWQTDYKVTEYVAGDEKILLTQLFFNGW